MDKSKTVFYLIPQNQYAGEIVDDDANHNRRDEDPGISPKPFLRIGLDQKPNIPLHLARFGRREYNDVILNTRFSRNDQCYFDFNKDTGELLLHDISESGDTELWDEKKEHCQIRKTPRQCVVLLTPDPHHNSRDGYGRVWIFKIRSAEFFLIPRIVPGGQGEAEFTKERLEFAGQPDPEQTREGTEQRIFNSGLESMQSEGLTTTYKSRSTASYSSRNTRFRTPLEPEEDEVIRYTKLQQLGTGGQGEVYKVVDMYDGNHYACKIVAVKGWRTHSEKEFRAKVEKEVKLVKQVGNHGNIVPYIHTQGFETGENIEIFMPVYEGSLHSLISHHRPGSEKILKKMLPMLWQILLALDYVHTHNPQIIHRDIKPPNILYRGDKFFLTDFGIAKVVDTSKTPIGTPSYMAPELWEKGDQTPKVDIYALGVTVLECLEEFPSEKDRLLKWLGHQQWHQHLQELASQHSIAYMLADKPSERPTARELLDRLAPYPSVQSPRNNTAPSSFASPPIPNLANWTAHSPVPTPMDWIPTLQPTPVAAQYTPPRKIPHKLSDITRSNSGRSRNRRQKRSQTSNASSQYQHHTRSQSAGIAKQTSSSKKKRPSRRVSSLKPST